MRGFCFSWETVQAQVSPQNAYLERASKLKSWFVCLFRLFFSNPHTQYDMVHPLPPSIPMLIEIFNGASVFFIVSIFVFFMVFWCKSTYMIWQGAPLASIHPLGNWNFQSDARNATACGHPHIARMPHVTHRVRLAYLTTGRRMDLLKKSNNSICAQCMQVLGLGSES